MLHPAAGGAAMVLGPVCAAAGSRCIIYNVWAVVISACKPYHCVLLLVLVLHGKHLFQYVITAVQKGLHVIAS